MRSNYERPTWWVTEWFNVKLWFDWPPPSLHHSSFGDTVANPRVSRIIWMVLNIIWLWANVLFNLFWIFCNSEHFLNSQVVLRTQMSLTNDYLNTLFVSFTILKIKTNFTDGVLKNIVVRRTDDQHGCRRCRRGRCRCCRQSCCRQILRKR